MDNLVLEMIKKYKVLSNWTNEKIEKMNKVLSDWENFKNMLEDHQMVVGQQIETMKNNLISEMQRVLNMFETFNSRWQQYKPKGYNDENNLKFKKIIDFLKNSRTEWNALKEQKEKIV
jgi:hypothetical protein